ncbi:MAG: hypothetical protein L3J75_04655 [Methylococcaceae bacterium]|nr:hypothetical protein [Methylococcaceae bacterium]
MSFPVNNRGFKQGDFSGYIKQGRCDVILEFSFISPFTSNTSIIRPVGSGKFFAILDIPTLIKADGNRKPSSAEIPKPADTRAYQFIDDFSGMTTFGIDGAILEIDNVTVKLGEALVFRWRFLSYDTIAGGNNDFALFDACHDAHADPSARCYRKVLAHALDLSGAGDTGWVNWRWQPNQDFNGVLRWIVSNGVLSNQPPAAISNSMRARPSSLLIDMIKIESV